MFLSNLADSICEDKALLQIRSYNFIWSVLKYFFIADGVLVGIDDAVAVVMAVVVVAIVKEQRTCYVLGLAVVDGVVACRCGNVIAIINVFNRVSVIGLGSSAGSFSRVRSKLHENMPAVVIALKIHPGG